MFQDIRGFEGVFPFRTESERQHPLRIPYIFDDKFLFSYTLVISKTHEACRTTAYNLSLSTYPNHPEI